MGQLLAHTGASLGWSDRGKVPDRIHKLLSSFLGLLKLSSCFWSAKIRISLAFSFGSHVRRPPAQLQPIRSRFGSRWPKQIDNWSSEDVRVPHSKVSPKVTDVSKNTENTGRENVPTHLSSPSAIRHSSDKRISSRSVEDSFFTLSFGLIVSCSLLAQAGSLSTAFATSAKMKRPGPSPQ